MNQRTKPTMQLQPFRSKDEARDFVRFQRDGGRRAMFVGAIYRMIHRPDHKHANSSGNVAVVNLPGGAMGALGLFENGQVLPISCAGQPAEWYTY